MSKRNQCSGDSVRWTNEIRSRRQVLESSLAHKRYTLKYTISEHVHSRGMNISRWDTLEVGGFFASPM
ncbi:hypothetical protein KGM_200682 [Danaus plexippus plexippus]|uniref:Uncharacterized protein n=1 Tax=Danaus plexippus plexippus TaxID=278856 RepID=A0A212EYP1_DANPL|nr:hypothetical protein KGM_200682 [Danaus plexippus plexippus]